MWQVEQLLLTVNCVWFHLLGTQLVVPWQLKQLVAPTGMCIADLPVAPLPFRHGEVALYTRTASGTEGALRVLVCDTKVPVEEALLLNLDTCTDLGIRRSLRPQQLPPTTLAYLSPRPRVAYFFEPARESDPEQ